MSYSNSDGKTSFFSTIPRLSRSGILSFVSLGEFFTIWMKMSDHF